MKKQKPSEYPIDILLKQTLKDDLPTDVEMHMNIRLSRFREKVEKQKQHRPGIYGFFTAFSDLCKLKVGPQLVKSPALAFASIVLIILLTAALFIPVDHSQNSPSEALSTLTTAIYVSQQISRINSMECTAEATTRKGEHLDYSIRWTPHRTRVHIIRQDKTIAKTLWITDRDVTIANTANGTVRHVKDIEHIDDPQFYPIKEFISPAALKARLTGKWHPREYERQKECDQGVFAVANPGEKVNTEVTVDMCTFLPILMKKTEIGVNIRFIWKPPFPHRLFELNI